MTMLSRCLAITLQWAKRDHCLHLYTYSTSYFFNFTAKQEQATNNIAIWACTNKANGSLTGYFFFLLLPGYLYFAEHGTL